MRAIVVQHKKSLPCLDSPQMLRAGCVVWVIRPLGMTVTCTGSLRSAIIWSQSCPLFSLKRWSHQRDAVSYVDSSLSTNVIGSHRDSTVQFPLLQVKMFLTVSIPLSLSVHPIFICSLCNIFLHAFCPLPFHHLNLNSLCNSYFLSSVTLPPRTA